MLGLPPEDFWAATPRQYFLLLERHRERERKDEYLCGVMAATIANWSMHAPEEPKRPKDFPLPLLQDTPIRARRRDTKAKIAEDMKRLEQHVALFAGGSKNVRRLTRAQAEGRTKEQMYRDAGA